MQHTLEPWERSAPAYPGGGAAAPRGGVVPCEFAEIVIEDAEVDRLLTSSRGLPPDEETPRKAVEPVGRKLSEDFHASLEGPSTPFRGHRPGTHVFRGRGGRDGRAAFLAATEAEPAS